MGHCDVGLLQVAGMKGIVHRTDEDGDVEVGCINGIRYNALDELHKKDHCTCVKIYEY